MFSKTFSVRRSAFTLRALVRLFARMRSKMSVQVGLLCCSVSALRAFVGLLTRMRLEVFIEVPLFRRTIVAIYVVACVEFLAGMPSRVHKEVALLCCAVIAVLTTVRLLSAMYSEMIGDLAFHIRTITTFFASKRFRTRMRSNMTVHMALLRRSVVAMIA